jgi:hypothetical protein
VLALIKDKEEFGCFKRFNNFYISILIMFIPYASKNFYKMVVIFKRKRAKKKQRTKDVDSS